MAGQMRQSIRHDLNGLSRFKLVGIRFMASVKVVMLHLPCSQTVPRVKSLGPLIAATPNSWYPKSAPRASSLFSASSIITDAWLDHDLTEAMQALYSDIMLLNTSPTRF